LARLSSNEPADADASGVPVNVGPVDATAGSETGDQDGGDAMPADSATDRNLPDALGSGPFGTVSLVTALSNPTADDEDPTFTQDELELYFMSNRGGSQDIWVSKRVLATDPWGAPVRVAELSSPASDQGPAVSLDGLGIWFSSDRDDDAGTGFDIWTSSRASRDAPWGAPRRVAELSSPATDEAPAIDEAELVLVFVSDRPGGVGGRDIYMSSRTSTTALWGPPVNLVDINTTANEWDPFIGDLDRQLFWAANKPKEDIRQSTRSSSTQPFSPFQGLTELGTPDYDPTLSMNLRHIMFGSSRSGNQEIYEAFR